MDQEQFKQFLEMQQAMITTLFIRGLKDNSIREHLLQSDITEFQEIVSKAMALEASRLDSKLISLKHLPTSTSDLPDINKNHHFLVIVDAKYKWAEVEVCSSAPTSSSTIEMLQNVFSRYGFPDIMVSDNAAIFTSDTFHQFCKEGRIFQKFIAPGHPATNRLAERNIQTLKNRLFTMIEEPFTMKQKVRVILFRYRATPLASGKTPSELFLNRQIRIKLYALKPPKHQKSSIRHTKARQYKVGDRVQARNYSNNKNLWKPGTIIKMYGLLHYLIKLDSGYIFKRHIDQLRLTEISLKTVKFAPTVQEDTSEEPGPHHPFEDLITIPTEQPPPQINEQPNEQPQHETGNESPVLRRSNRTHCQLEYLKDFVRS
ncbi:uncharacterized protein LOC128994282 [Macrosteles quadrilineatus]|uniref:uncharacterized protein LOC128994282 n=1 Tax=Macrosteles quadrilineatus TaxID=74068 RepID=UPI0023E2C70F|nr:uncharacterized protein LOC128994282 [Macrosteles quadrilineatus]